MPFSVVVGHWLSQNTVVFFGCLLLSATVNTEDVKFPEVCEHLQEANNSLIISEQFKSQTFVPRRSDEQVADFFYKEDDCSSFKKSVFDGWPHRASYVTEEETQFPIAFSLSVHRDADQVSRLVRLLYRKQNSYCIHVDRKASRKYYEAVRNIARCFGENVHVLPRGRSVRVIWGRYGILEAVLRCAKLLLHMDTKWRYLINLSGQEMPLRTNWEFVSLLKAINGSNIVEYDDFEKFPERSPKRVTSFKWIKGSVYAAVKREFVHFVLYNQRAIAIDDILRREQFRPKHPDETLYPTLNHNPNLGAPGACVSARKSIATDPTTWYLARYVMWFGPCLTNFSVRTVCILGLPDLPHLVSAPHLFANKFHYDFHPAAYDCMEHRLFSKWRQEVITGKLDPQFDLDIYAQLQCSRSHL
ncbi:Glycosyltransferase 14 family member [Fasciola gigantica]|uniref:Glycosyltransferase 14 family member n=1 Tax=Fasciola gigantica TaxID=46835 RepID=A0A504Y6Q8_FASGI|nr:Glycosyltransferase 14 family member [Fasciola gigantica]